MKEALLYEKLSGKKVRCHVCQRRCLISPGSTGFCKTRVNKDGKLYTTIYGIISGANNDPIEKKPVFHFKPGSLCFSLGTFGCNFRCKFCQNYDISYVGNSEFRTQSLGQKLTPEKVVELAIKEGAEGIAFTYNEPAIWLEYSLDCAKLAKSLASHLKGVSVNLYTCWVTNGFATKETIDLIAPYLDIYRVDLKSFNDSFYQKLIAVPKASGVFEMTKYVHDKYPKIHLECVTNIIPGWNDSRENLRRIAQWIVKNLGPLTPWHVTRFYPAAQMMDTPETPPETIIEAQKIGQNEGLSFVYLGNYLTETGENTYCPKCKTLNVQRRGYEVKILAVKKERGACPERTLSFPKGESKGYCQKCGQDLNLIL